MTNEQLAAFIKQGGNDELIPILWERIRKIMYMKSDRVYSALQSRFIQCGYDVWDLKQSCYTAFLKAIEGSVTGQDISLFALRYRFFSGSTGGHAVK